MTNDKHIKKAANDATLFIRAICEARQSGRKLRARQIAALGTDCAVSLIEASATVHGLISWTAAAYLEANRQGLENGDQPSNPKAAAKVGAELLVLMGNDAERSG
jgi:hypothetical protein